MRYFLGLLREAGPRVNPPSGLGLVTDDVSTPGKPASTDRVYLEDFRVALKVSFLLLLLIKPSLIIVTALQDYRAGSF